MRKLSVRQKSISMAVLTILVITIIFANSVLSMEQSGQISSMVTAWLTPFFGIVLTEHFVRKLAHIIEYFVLGIFLTLFFRKVSVKPFFSALLIAVIDESLQIVSHRGSSLIDVWIDFISAAVGICLVLAIKKVCGQKFK